MLEHEKQIY